MKELQELQEKYHSKGLEIFLFPCNQFGRQEPGPVEKTIENYKHYGSTAHWMEEIDVNGSNTHPLWAYMKSKLVGSFFMSVIKWNFSKFLIDHNGVPIKRYSPQQNPLSMVKDIEAALAAAESVES